MKKLLLASLSVLFLGYFVVTVYAQERVLVLRQAEEYRKDVVAVEAYLEDNIMEVTVTARMPKTRPDIHNVIIVGPKLGRLSPESKQTMRQTVESDDEEPYSTKERGAFISFSKKEKTRKSKGRLARELMFFEIPRDRIVKDKKYKLWVLIKSEQEAGYRQKGGRPVTFKFDLENLPELLEQTEE